MAIEYSLDIESALPIASLRHLIKRHLEAHDVGTSLLAPELLIDIHDTSQMRREVLAEAFGLSSSRFIGFRLEKNSTREMGYGNLLIACDALLQGTADNCVFLFNGEDPLLLRLHGRVYLNENPFWTPDRISMISMPWQPKKIDRL